MSQNEKDKIIEKLAKQAEKYIKLILKEYGEYIPDEKKEKLRNIKDLKEHITIEDTGTITCFYRRDNSDDKIYMPLLADKILKLVKYFPIFKDENHKVYDDKNIVINNNTFVDYVKHIAKKKASAEEFYEENLLHEVMHFCGARGSQALEEGLTEYNTRKLAQKYNLKTTGCGYPKEVKIAHELEQIFDEKAMTLFIFNQPKAIEYIENKYGQDACNFLVYFTLKMNEEFRNKYYAGTEQYNKLTAPLKKIKNYEKIDYTDIYEMINNYKADHPKKEETVEKEITQEKQNNDSEYYIIIKDKEYIIPTLVSSFNEEVFKEYTKEQNGKQYLDIKRLISEERIDDIDKISFQCCALVGELCLVDEEHLNAYNKLGGEMRHWDNMSKFHKKENEIGKACEDQFMSMLPALNLYKNLIEEERKNRRTR